MTEKAIRGGICQATHRYPKANNKYMKNYDKNIESSSKYEYAFDLSAANSIIIFPPNSSLNRPGTFLFLPIGRGFLSFLS